MAWHGSDYSQSIKHSNRNQTIIKSFHDYSTVIESSALRFHSKMKSRENFKVEKILFQVVPCRARPWDINGL